MRRQKPQAAFCSARGLLRGLQGPFPRFALSFALMTGEAFLLRHFQFQRHDSMYLLLVPVMLFLYRFLLCIPVKSDRAFRTASTWIYVLHPAFIVVVRGIAKPLGLTGLLVDNSLVHYLAVSFLSVAAAFAMVWLQSMLKARPGPGGGGSPVQGICRLSVPGMALGLLLREILLCGIAV